LYLAEEAFFCGTGVQISAITRADFREIGSGEMGETTARLRSLYFDIVRGRMPKYRGWCHPVFETKPSDKPSARTPVSVQ
jgi:branched-chain amino acid aminotransferase